MMKSCTKVILSALVLTLLLSATVFAYDPPYTPTREVIIENTAMPNCIMDAIEADVASVGAETAGMTKYILRRGEVYVHTQKYSTTFSVWLEAEPGDGPLPRILGVNLGGEAPRMVQPAADLVMIGLLYEGLDSDGNHTDNAPVRPKGEGMKAWIENCVFRDHRLEVGRTDGSYQSHFWVNNIFTRNMQNNRWIKGNVFYLKDLPEDSLVIVDNTFYNNTSQLIRGTKAGLKFFDFSNNTVSNMGGLMDFYMFQNNGAEDAILDFGRSQNVVCKDNIFMNTGVFGYTPTEADSLFILNIELTDSTGTLDISNNNIARHPDFETLNPDSVVLLNWFDPELESVLGTTGAAHGFISEYIEFNNVPDMQAFKDAVTLFWSSDTGFVTPLNLPTTPSAFEVDFGYTAPRSATASSTGGALGSSRWTAVTAVEDQAAPVSSFALNGNYPNPFNPSTHISFDLPNTADVSVKVMNLRGQVVYETTPERMTAGNHELSINAANWSTGVYVYQLTAQDHQTQHVANGRMLLMK